MLHAGDKIGLICCSDGKKLEERPQIEKLIQLLKNEYDLETVLAPTIYQENETIFSGTPKKRAEALMSLYKDQSVKMIFDLSGGDSANGILTFLDYEQIKLSNKAFVGYSDLTVVLNAIFTKTHSIGYNYQLLHLLKNDVQKNFFKRFFMSYPLSDALTYKWITEPKSIETVVIGGNIRCLLKLAGTSYWPIVSDITLLLEARGGEIEQISCYLDQLEQTGLLQSCTAVLLGQFTMIEKNNQETALITLVQSFAKKHGFSIIKTEQIGHSTESIPFPIGQLIKFY
ncbi:LD-carboxypeptidase [Carnobacterium sp. TMP28]|uniref:LD-carboxypeptidase n=1 Tax=Carnobacterium sp. TMP28 TaxID=3397060 RepID=UPI0039DFE42E